MADRPGQAVMEQPQVRRAVPDNSGEFSFPGLGQPVGATRFGRPIDGVMPGADPAMKTRPPPVARREALAAFPCSRCPVVLD